MDVEYIPEPLPPDDELAKQFAHVFKKFSQFQASADDDPAAKETDATATATAADDDDDPTDRHDDQLQLATRHQVEDNKVSSKENNNKDKPLSKRRIKELTRMSVAELKHKVPRPQLVESHDITARDPIFLLHLKSVKNSVPVPRHWNSKRRYLQGKRGYEKPPFQLPDFIRQTGIMEMRDSILDKDSAKSLKAKTRERVQPKMGKIQIDYQQLHDAFFKWQTKPRLTIHGDLYYEGKEFEKRFKMEPGHLSDELRKALGMPTGPDSKDFPPPWYAAMKRHGPPPSYPGYQLFKIPSETHEPMDQ